MVWIGRRRVLGREERRRDLDIWCFALGILEESDVVECGEVGRRR